MPSWSARPTDRSQRAGWAKRRICICRYHGAIGTLLMMWYWFNFSSAMRWLYSVCFYTGSFTPRWKNKLYIRRWSEEFRCVALPYRLGGSYRWFHVGGWILFGIQFIWQFPHFWAVPGWLTRIIPKPDLNYCLLIRGQLSFTAIQSIVPAYWWYRLACCRMHLVYQALSVSGSYWHATFGWFIQASCCISAWMHPVPAESNVQSYFTWWSFSLAVFIKPKSAKQQRVLITGLYGPGLWIQWRR